jgi:hypothetical protein
LNQLVCDSKPSEMRALESLSVDEYYQTLSTWMKIIDEKNKSVEKIKGSDNPGGSGSNRKRSSVSKQ